MKKSTNVMLIGFGIAAVAMIPLVGGAIAQSPPQSQSERFRDEGPEDDREFAQERDRDTYRRPEARDDRRGDERGEWRNRDGRFKWHRRHARDGRRHHGREGRFLRRYDTNGDGRVTRIEFAEIVKRRFESLDANRDGEISRDELANRPRRNRHWR